MIPAELWYKHKIDQNTIQILGYTSYIFISVANSRNKADPKSRKIYLLVYTMAMPTGYGKFTDYEMNFDFYSESQKKPRKWML